jgi:hypothetical protein
MLPSVGPVLRYALFCAPISPVVMGNSSCCVGCSCYECSLS